MDYAYDAACLVNVIWDPASDLLHYRQGISLKQTSHYLGRSGAGKRSYTASPRVAGTGLAPAAVALFVT